MKFGLIQAAFEDIIDMDQGSVISFESTDAAKHAICTYPSTSKSASPSDTENSSSLPSFPVLADNRPSFCMMSFSAGLAADEVDYSPAVLTLGFLIQRIIALNRFFTINGPAKTREINCGNGFRTVLSRLPNWEILSGQFCLAR
jgi:hypothetical protein